MKTGLFKIQGYRVNPDRVDYAHVYSTDGKHRIEFKTGSGSLSVPCRSQAAAETELARYEQHVSDGITGLDHVHLVARSNSGNHNWVTGLFQRRGKKG